MRSSLTAMIASLLDRHAHSLDALASGIHEEMHRAIPAERVAIGFLHPDGGTVITGPVRSARPCQLDTGYRASLSPSLVRLLQTRVPRVLNDLPAYVATHKSPPTRLLVEEGWRSSLTLPLLSGDSAVGFLWLCSRKTNAYTREHADAIRLFNSPIAALLAKARLAGRVAVQTNLSARLQDENLRLRELVRVSDDLPEIIGESPVWRKTLQRLRTVAATDSTVLIRGETGTGKELIARALHKLSPRNPKPFVAVNCGVFSAELIASELFGHERGAFTGAVTRKLGRVELAQGGTLFLDEVGELPLETQAKLLRFLQEREFERVGGTSVHRADVRVIAATHRDLEAARRDGKFRDDLFFRLNVFPIHVPPLRERKEDIEPLLRVFVQKVSQKLGKQIVEIDAHSMQQCLYYHWPGNVRELENLVERSAILCEGPVLSIDPLIELDAGQSPAAALTMFSVVRAHLLKVLRMTNGRVYGERGAAKILGLKPSTLQAKIKKHGIRAEDIRGRV